MRAAGRYPCSCPPEPADDVLAHNNGCAVCLSDLGQLPTQEPARRVEGPALQLCARDASLRGRGSGQTVRPAWQAGCKARHRSSAAWVLVWVGRLGSAPQQATTAQRSKWAHREVGRARMHAGMASTRQQGTSPTCKPLPQLHAQQRGHRCAQAVPRDHHLPALQLQLAPAGRRRGRRGRGEKGGACQERTSVSGRCRQPNNMRSALLTAAFNQICAGSVGSTTPQPDLSSQLDNTQHPKRTAAWSVRARWAARSLGRCAGWPGAAGQRQG